MFIFENSAQISLFMSRSPQTPLYKHPSFHHTHTHTHTQPPPRVSDSVTHVLFYPTNTFLQFICPRPQGPLFPMCTAAANRLAVALGRGGGWSLGTGKRLQSLCVTPTGSVWKSEGKCLEMQRWLRREGQDAVAGKGGPGEAAKEWPGG